ncbi:MAG TPA: EAL domain-containing protein [Chakrabartia sp.]|nr:EAL domain-containing protein [Chakrabartia sp.]
MAATPAVDPVAPTTDAGMLLKAFEESGRGWFWATDAHDILIHVSDSFRRRFQDTGTDILNKPLTDIFQAADADVPVRERLPFLVNRRVPLERMTLRSTCAGDQHWWEVSGTPCLDAAGQFAGYRGFCVDVTEQLHSSRSATELALFDPLTGLPNRLNSARFLEESMRGIARPGASCTVMLIDLDRFKQVNDSLGHPAGDALLKSVAGRLEKIIGNTENIFRLGGDEFQIILPQAANRSDLGELADRIINSLSQPYSIEGSRCVIGASIGLAVAPADGVSGDELVRNADLALYAAKGEGRGCHRFFSSSLSAVAEDRRALEMDLRDALANGEFSLCYQPVVSTKSSTVTGVEALVRWTHPVRGPVSPAVFIPIVEEANLIDRMGEWILRKACEDAASWPMPIKVAVNVSPIQFANEALPSMVINALASSGLPAERLELELTEGVFLNESNETDTMFTRLKEIGVRLALDDFGTGYSSLGYLKTAPFDKIKIDQSFVRGATLPGSRNSAIIAAIVALATALDMETTAEGIETLDQLDLIRDLGVSLVQGYVYSRPLTNDVLSDHLGDESWNIAPQGPARQRSERRAMYRKAGVILDCQYHAVVIRNLSESGAFIEGLPDLAVGTQIAVDFGDCQIEIATVRRGHKRGHGVEFVQRLVSDGAGGLCTARKVSPYVLSTMGLSGTDYLGSSRTWDPSNTANLASLARKLGLSTQQAKSASDLDDPSYAKVKQVFNTANPLQSLLLQRAGGGERMLTPDDWERLKAAVESSQNTQLKFIIALVVLTGVRLHELMDAEWDHVDRVMRIWTIPAISNSPQRRIPLSSAALEIINQLPRFDECPNLIVNPRTRKPYNSFYGSWDAARKKAGLDHLGIHDLRNSISRTW